MVTRETVYTVDEFESHAAAHPEHLLELVHGRIVEKVTTEEHGSIALTIGMALRQWQKEKNVEGIAGVEISHRNPNDDRNVRIPDVSFRYTENKPQSSAAPALPDFAVEIKSPTNTYKELREKATFYVENGVRFVWLVYPSRQIVEVYYDDGTSELFTAEHTLSGGDVLNGFEMPVNAIFT